MADDNNEETPTQPLKEIPIDWEALENAFENNAPEVHSYLHLVTGDVLRVVDGVADPQMHARIASDQRYLRIEPVSSREQYRWMERYIPLVEEPKLRSRLEVSIDGKGAFRRFKDVLMAFGPERERWFAYRSERLRTFMEAWLTAHSIKAIARSEWVGPPPQDEQPADATAEEAPKEAPITPEAFDFRRGRNIDTLRNRLRDLADSLGPRDLDTVVAFADFLRARRTARSFAHHHAHSRRDDQERDEATGGDEAQARESGTDEAGSDSESPGT
ncbi:MAG: hypothetical protein HY898_28105 [Deltaproteobacteria bacterium]|nr:hypothetical protein [Deltaproteobacteria bacterium]